MGKGSEQVHFHLIPKRKLDICLDPVDLTKEGGGMSFLAKQEKSVASLNYFLEKGKWRIIVK